MNEEDAMTALSEWIAAQRALEQKATKGPWWVAAPDAFPWYRDGCGTKGEDTLTILGDQGYGVFSVPESITDGPWKPNVDFIAASRVTVPTALRLVEVLAEEWGKLPCWCHNVDHICEDDEPFIPVPKDWKCHRCVILAECERIVGAERTKEANGE